MLQTLKFVHGAVAKKDYVPALTHFQIANGRIIGFNGAIALSSPIDLDINCSPRATPFVKAIKSCDGTVQLHLTPAKRLAVKSGSFVAYVECLPEDAEYPEIKPEGERIEIDGSKMLQCFSTLLPFISEDASRPWSRGILLRGQSAFATNNIILVEKWVGLGFPECNIPAEAVEEIVRIGEPPSSIQGGPGSITFHFDSGKWLRSQLLATDWPEIESLLNRSGGFDSIPETFFDAVERLIPFEAELGAGFFLGNKLATHREEEIGAVIEVPGLPLLEGCYNLKQLLRLKDIAKTITFTYPAPSIFYGENIRGIIVGMQI